MFRMMAVNAITQYIDDNLETIPVDINCLVDYSGYSRRYLQLMFKERIGMPLGRYIQLRRITRAAVLLRLTKLPLSKIAERLFYDSQQSFTREFKKNSGYTPLQYRNNNVWSFKNMTGHLETETMVPSPTICCMANEEFYGTRLCYTESIPNVKTTAQTPKWIAVDTFLAQGNNILYLSHKVTPGEMDEQVNIEVIIRGRKVPADTYGSLKEGLYARFSFTGSREEYTRFMYNVYFHSLPFYGLQRANEFDLEIISEAGDGQYVFEYYLPVYDEI
ncbi:TPA: helix-turn-helix domain-containing protein [Salmonella enterica subsp. enterica serovar Virchow]